jgi:hypothetical protein
VANRYRRLRARARICELEWSCRSGERPRSHEPPNDASREHCCKARCSDDCGPLEAESSHEVRQGTADGEGTDEHAERQPATASEPTRHDLHPARIDPSQSHARHESQHHRCGHDRCINEQQSHIRPAPRTAVTENRVRLETASAKLVAAITSAPTTKPICTHDVKPRDLAGIHVPV